MHGMSSDYGIKISRTGVDVRTAADTDLVLSSEFVTPMIAKVIRFTTPGSTAHGMGYPPAFIGVKADGAGGWESCTRGYFSGGVPAVYIDATNVTYRAGETGDAYVFILVDPLNE